MQNLTKATKVRLRFAKCDELRLVSHHDLMRCLERMLRRAELPMAATQGFNPRPKITFALALGLGIEARAEVVDLELSEPMDTSTLLARLAVVAPPGLVFHEACALPPDASAPRPRTVEYCIPILDDRRAEARSALETLLARESWPFIRRRADRELSFDLRQQVQNAELTSDGMLLFRLIVSPGGSVRPEELLEALALRDLLDSGAVLTRTNVVLGP
ncbi:MAG TPA: TIGR03936 family radical SAM-associated protein [Isosphaeraceae bacterium]|nr:TIGR03936 family radical SAM-associated protein [Isosphaeraceae bacterium]